MNDFDYVTLIPNCVPLQLLDELLRLPRDLSAATTVSNSEVDSSQTYRNTNWIALPLEIRENIKKSISNLYNDFLQKKYKKNIDYVEDPQFLNYNVGGKYGEHNDSEDYVGSRLQRVSERDLTVIVFVNDDYEGGELELVQYGVKFKPSKGTVIVFPSYIDFSHQVLPVIRGQRFTLVSWICTDERIYSRPYSPTALSAA